MFYYMYLTSELSLHTAPVVYLPDPDQAGCRLSVHANARVHKLTLKCRRLQTPQLAGAAVHAFRYGARIRLRRPCQQS